MLHRPCLMAILAGLVAAGCAGPLDLAEELYRSGALREAVDVWRSVPEDSSERARAEGRLRVVEGELARMLRRFEKQAAFYEAEGRLAEAVLYYRLAVKSDPARGATLGHVQKLVRELRRRTGALRAEMLASLEQGDLMAASRQASLLLALNPLDPAVQIDARQVRDALSEQMQRNMESGRLAYAAGDLGTARAEFQAVQALEPGNEEALGYLAYIESSERRAQRMATPEPASPQARERPSSGELLAEGYFRKGRDAQQRNQPFRAISEYERALGANPHHPGARRELAQLRTGLTDRVPALYADGNRYFQDDDLHNALKAWNQVLLIQPDHVQAAENAERARRILERLEEIQSGS